MPEACQIRSAYHREFVIQIKLRTGASGGPVIVWAVETITLLPDGLADLDKVRKTYDR